jgi:hypothetical protein
MRTHDASNRIDAVGDRAGPVSFSADFRTHE